MQETRDSLLARTGFAAPVRGDARDRRPASSVLLANGDGPIVMLRAYLDALPFEEATAALCRRSGDDRRGTPSRSGTVWPLSHVACLWARARCSRTHATRAGPYGGLPNRGRDGRGARAMSADGPSTGFPKRPSCSASTSLAVPAEAVTLRRGGHHLAADSLQIRLFGRGAHGSMRRPASIPY